MMKTSFFFVFLIFCVTAVAQKVETVYLNDQDSTSNLYIVVYPPKLPYKGYLFLIPGMFQKAEDVLVQTNLPKYAAKKGLLTIIPTFEPGISSIGIDDATQASLAEMLNHVTRTYKLKDQDFFLGGFSMGGTCAIKYAEVALRRNYVIKPTAIFAIDSPLDFERLFNIMTREVNLPNSTEDGLAENNYMLKRLRKLFGGSPNEQLANYHTLSPYTFSDTTQQAIRPLINLPIRLYTEPDVLWWLNEGIDYTGMNATDFAALTNELKRMGSTKIELVLTSNKGYRKPDNIRHPHSWSIAEPKELVEWLFKQQ